MMERPVGEFNDESLHTFSLSLSRFPSYTFKHKKKEFFKKLLAYLKKHPNYSNNYMTNVIYFSIREINK